MIKKHLADFENNDMKAIDSWTDVKFRVNLQNFSDPYVSFFPEQGEEDMEELDSKLSNLDVKGAPIQEQVSEEDAISDIENSNLVVNTDSSSDEEIKCPKPSKIRKSNYHESSYKSFLDELNQE